ncbi:MAG TPA: R3H domain-containing nucleic acid-binding protein [Anaeromyxobacteraceae bacterium]|nr:R3H domain-containing nucleic acid-binding protein [Anaeromyxobacteraceae bacterium]
MIENQGPPPPREAPEKVQRAKAFCEELLRRMGARVEVAARESAEAIGLSLTAAEGNEVELGSALLEAVQYLVNRVVNPRPEGRKWVNLDVGGFAEDADPVVKAMAQRLAEAARRTGQVLAVAPISARERRQIHLALVGVEGVSTRSEGEGIFRQLLIVPAASGAAPGGGAAGS